MVEKWGRIDKDGTIWKDDGSHYEHEETGVDRLISKVFGLSVSGGLFALVSQCIASPFLTKRNQQGQKFAGKVFDFFLLPSGEAFWLRIALMVGIGFVLGVIWWLVSLTRTRGAK